VAQEPAFLPGIGSRRPRGWAGTLLVEYHEVRTRCGTPEHAEVAGARLHCRSASTPPAADLEHRSRHADAPACRPPVAECPAG
jgi:hypothetical protein